MITENPQCEDSWFLQKPWISKAKQKKIQKVYLDDCLRVLSPKPCLDVAVSKRRFYQETHPVLYSSSMLHFPGQSYLLTTFLGRFRGFCNL